MFKIVFAILGLVAIATAQYVYDYGGYHGLDSAPSHHGPFASSVNTGIRRFGSTGGAVLTAGYYDAVPAAYYL